MNDIWTVIDFFNNRGNCNCPNCERLIHRILFINANGDYFEDCQDRFHGAQIGDRYYFDSYNKRMDPTPIQTKVLEVEL